ESVLREQALGGRDALVRGGARRRRPASTPFPGHARHRSAPRASVARAPGGESIALSTTSQINRASCPVVRKVAKTRAREQVAGTLRATDVASSRSRARARSGAGNGTRGPDAEHGEPSGTPDAAPRGARGRRRGRPPR